MTTDQWQRAFVLHRREYSESSLLVEFFTEHHGRITLLAKGARRARSPLKAVLQPFTPLLVRWSGKGDLKHSQRQSLLLLLYQWKRLHFIAVFISMRCLQEC